jgi:hypothetical protein
MSKHIESKALERRASRRLAALAAVVAILAASAACSGRDRARTVDADLGHDLDLASTTGIELANRGRAGTQVVSAIEEAPRSAAQRSARSATAAGRRRHRVATPRIDAPPATVMVADHETVATASTEAAAGPDPESTAPSPAPNPGPQSVPEPVSYPTGRGSEPGRGTGIGDVLGGVIGVVLRGGAGGGIDPCDERHGRGRRGGMGGIPLPVPGGVWSRFPTGGTTFPRN